MKCCRGFCERFPGERRDVRNHILPAALRSVTFCETFLLSGFSEIWALDCTLRGVSTGINMKLVYPERNICSLNKPQQQELGTCKMKMLTAQYFNTLRTGDADLRF